MGRTKASRTVGTSGELRRHRRHRVLTRVSIRYGDLGDAAFEVRDLSLEGIFLCSGLLYELGDQLALHITLPEGYELECGGEVVRVEVGLPGQGQGMGIAFRDLADADRAVIEKLLVREGKGRNVVPAPLALRA
jgi:hypothetical protein